MKLAILLLATLVVANITATSPSDKTDQQVIHQPDDEEIQEMSVHESEEPAEDNEDNEVTSHDEELDQVADPQTPIKVLELIQNLLRKRGLSARLRARLVKRRRPVLRRRRPSRRLTLRRQLRLLGRLLNLVEQLVYERRLLIRTNDVDRRVFRRILRRLENLIERLMVERLMFRIGDIDDVDLFAAPRFFGEDIEEELSIDPVPSDEDDVVTTDPVVMWPRFSRSRLLRIVRILRQLFVVSPSLRVKAQGRVTTPDLSSLSIRLIERALQEQLSRQSYDDGEDDDDIVVDDPIDDFVMPSFPHRRKRIRVRFTSPALDGYGPPRSPFRAHVRYIPV